MKFVDEYRDPVLAQTILAEIRKTVTRPWVIMEVCGGHTHAIVKHGIDQLLPDKIELVHGPGCPVCVTPLTTLDQAIELAGRSEIIFTSFGDMLRVPASYTTLLTVKAKGGDVRIVYSSLEALTIARQNPQKQVVFFGVGFETTAPGSGMAIKQAAREGLTNFSVLASHVLIPPAMSALLNAHGNRVQGYLAAGHVCVITGINQYKLLARQHKVPIIVTGFEPLDILSAIFMLIKQLEHGKHEVQNQYSRSVNTEGNKMAQKLMNEIFKVTDRQWRGIGLLRASGLAIKDEFTAFDAEKKFDLTKIKTEESTKCLSGAILQGLTKPDECTAFAKECLPSHPLGATMVSSEGACAAYYQFMEHGK